jgi:hypothetical protein
MLPCTMNKSLCMPPPKPSFASLDPQSRNMIGSIFTPQYPPSTSLLNITKSTPGLPKPFNLFNLLDLRLAIHSHCHVQNSFSNFSNKASFPCKQPNLSGINALTLALFSSPLTPNQTSSSAYLLASPTGATHVSKPCIPSSLLFTPVTSSLVWSSWTSWKFG